ncbi:MAG: helix-turn-helix domain-containing protein [Oscillospiraceae bacterium]|jgi:transcriptional regulator with XRE-family HTH domain|nr:helix-turn-helix domain-containing protein [Oscillospiraceae bacterium]
MIGERLSELRKDRGMTQKELANELSVSITTVSGYENNQSCPCDDTKIHIARIFNVSLDYLMGTIDDEMLLDRTNMIVLHKMFPEDVKKSLSEFVDLLNNKFTSHR